MVRGKRCGFTLTEMLVVLAIVGLIVGLALPALTGVLKGSKLTQAADQSESSFAISERVPIWVKFQFIS